MLDTPLRDIPKIAFNFFHLAKTASFLNIKVNLNLTIWTMNYTYSHAKKNQKKYNR